LITLTLLLLSLSLPVQATWEDELISGSIGGYFSPTELSTYLTNLKANFTDLIRTGSVDPTSVKGSSIYYAELFSTSGLASDERSSVMITAGQSAEQPLAVTQALYLLAKWANEYNTTSRTAYWLQTQKVYFVPMINPDAFAELKSNYTSGAAVTAGRVKNLKENNCTTTSQRGTNLNRNYNVQYGYDNTGSSNDTCSNYYRGSEAMSEPEVKAVAQLKSNWSPKLWIHIDGTGDFRMIPYSYSTSASLKAEDLSFYNSISSSFGGFKTQTSAYGTAANGAIIDYAYAGGAMAFHFSSSSNILAQSQILTKVKGDAAHYETLMDYASPQWKLSKKASEYGTCSNCTSSEQELSFYFSLKNEGLSSSTGTFTFVLTTSEKANYTVTTVLAGSASYEGSNSTIPLKSVSFTGAEDLNFSFSLGTVGRRTQTDVEIIIKQSGGSSPFKGSYSGKATLSKGTTLNLNSAAVTANSVNIPEADDNSGGDEEYTIDEEDESDDNATSSLLEGGGDHDEEAAIAAIAVILAVVGVIIIALLVFCYFKMKKGKGEHHTSENQEASVLGNQEGSLQIIKAQEPAVKADDINLSGNIKP